MIDITIRIVVAIVLISLKLYWIRAEQEAYEALPPTTKRRHGFIRHLKLIEFLFYVLIAIQLLGIQVFPFTPTLLTRAIGLALFAFGIFMSIAGRTALGDNWMHTLDYQIKSKQELVQNEMYTKVRHPIYSGAIFAKVGIELLLNSWLWVLFLFGATWFFYRQAKKEESILARHFGKEYLTYLQRTKMFVPYIF